MSNQTRWSEYEKLVLMELYNEYHWYRISSLAAAYNRQITPQGYISRSEKDVESQIESLTNQDLPMEPKPEPQTKYLTPTRVIRVNW